MGDIVVSIGEVKRDISTLVNRVAFGGERIVLTSRGKPKAAIVSIEDYERLTKAAGNDTVRRVEAWLVASDHLVAGILDARAGEPIDTDRILAEAKADLEERHDFLRHD